MNRIIRRAELSDLPRLNEIYNMAVRTRKCNCNLTIYGPKDRLQWFESHTDSHPMFVMEIDGVVVGYAHLSPYRVGLDALGRVAELTYYVDFSYHRQGIGEALIEAMLSEAKRLGFRKLIAIILSCNAASDGILRKFGFQQWGVMPDVADFGDNVYSHIYFGLSLA